MGNSVDNFEGYLYIASRIIWGLGILCWFEKQRIQPVDKLWESVKKAVFWRVEMGGERVVDRWSNLAVCSV